MKTVEKILKYKLLPLFDSEEEMNESMGNKYNEIIEAMQIYADQQSAIAVANREEEIKEWIKCWGTTDYDSEGNISKTVDYDFLLQFLSTPTEPTQATQPTKLSRKEFIEQIQNNTISDITSEGGYDLSKSKRNDKK